MERSYWPVISHCLGGVSSRVTNASSKAGPKDIPGYSGTYVPRTYVYMCVAAEQQSKAVTRRILVEPRLGSKTLPQITEPLSCPFVYWSILRCCNGTWEILARFSRLGQTKRSKIARNSGRFRSYDTFLVSTFGKIIKRDG